MDREQARETVRRLKAAGVEFRWRLFWYATGATVPPDADLSDVPDDDWGAECVPTFPEVPETDPRFEFLDAICDLYHSDSDFSEQLHDAAAAIDAGEAERDAERCDRQADEALAAMDRADALREMVDGELYGVARVAGMTFRLTAGGLLETGTPPLGADPTSTDRVLAIEREIRCRGSAFSAFVRGRLTADRIPF